MNDLRNKYRAWDKSLKKMIPGTDFAMYNGSPYPIEMVWEINEWWERAKKEYGNRLKCETSIDNFMANFVTSDWGCIDFANWKGIDDYIVMQYAGLFDKNQTPIYEGDVVRIEGGCSNHVVKYETGAFGYTPPMRVEWNFIPFAQHTHLNFIKDKSDEIEVIGNIHETPSLP